MTDFKREGIHYYTRTKWNGKEEEAFIYFARDDERYHIGWPFDYNAPWHPGYKTLRGAQRALQSNDFEFAYIGE